MQMCADAQQMGADVRTHLQMGADMQQMCADVQQMCANTCRWVQTCSRCVQTCSRCLQMCSRCAQTLADGCRRAADGCRRAADVRTCSCMTSYSKPGGLPCRRLLTSRYCFTSWEGLKCMSTHSVLAVCWGLKCTSTHGVLALCGLNIQVCSGTKGAEVSASRRVGV